MDRLETINTTKDMKDIFKVQRNLLLSSSKNYNNEMNNYANNIIKPDNNEKYLYVDNLNKDIYNIKEPVPYTDVSNNNNDKIKPLSETSPYSNFIPFPESTRDIEIKNGNNMDNYKDNLFLKKIENSPHPKKMYLNDPADKNELLENHKTIIENQPVNLNTFNNSYSQNTDYYIGEIGDKRKLSNIIFNSIIESYNEISNNLNEYQIYHILNNINIKDNKWSKNNTKDFVRELKNIINNQENIPDTNHIIQENRLFEKNTKEIEYYITIDSNDRDIEKWENPNFYQIIFGPNSDIEKNKGYINQSFNNVQCIELIEAIIPKKTYNGTNYDTLPYILLEIPELGHVYQGTNDYLRKTFSQLVFDKVVGNYRYSTFFESNKIKKIFNPRIALNKLTIKFLKPNGDLYDFGDYIDISDADCNEEIQPNNILTFKITCIQKQLDTMFLSGKH